MGVLRLLLAAFVVFEHCHLIGGYRLLPGNMAVEIFFIISGYYMSLILGGGKYDPYSMVGVTGFYTSRFFRLFPVFFITTLLTYILYVAAYLYLGREPTDAGPIDDWLASPTLSFLIGFSNWFMIGQDLPSLAHVGPSGITWTLGAITAPLADGSIWLGNARQIGQAWSIGTEIWFYLLIPFIIRFHSLLIFFFLVALLCIRFYIELFIGINSYFIFPLQLPMFLAGCLIYRWGPHFSNLWLSPLPILAACMGAWAFGIMGVDQYWKWLMYLLIVLGIPALFQLTHHSRLDRILGEQSYAVYLTHMFILSVLALLAKRAGFTVTGELLLSITLAFSLVLYKYIESPVSAWRQRFAAPIPA